MISMAASPFFTVPLPGFHAFPRYGAVYKSDPKCYRHTCFFQPRSKTSKTGSPTGAMLSKDTYSERSGQLACEQNIYVYKTCTRLAICPGCTLRFPQS